MASVTQFKSGTLVEYWYRGGEFVSTAIVIRHIEDVVTIQILNAANVNGRLLERNHELAIQDRIWQNGKSLRPTATTEYVTVEVDEPQYSSEEPF